MAELTYCLMFKRCLLITITILAFTAFKGFGDTDSTSVKLYHVNHLTVGTIIVAGSVADYLAIQPLRNKPVITDIEFANLNRNLLNPIDRWALNQSTSQYKTFQHISDYGQVPIFLLPPLLTLNKKFKKDWLDLLFIYWQGHTVTFFSYNYSFLGPRFQNKYRPLVYYDELPLEERNIGYNRSSFYSGHVASVTYTTFFMAKIYCDYNHIKGMQKFLCYGAASIIPAAEGYMRVRSLAHFPSDCLVGFALGATIGIITPESHKVHNSNLSYGLFSNPNASGLTICWTPSKKAQ